MKFMVEEITNTHFLLKILKKIFFLWFFCFLPLKTKDLNNMKIFKKKKNYRNLRPAPPYFSRLKEIHLPFHKHFVKASELTSSFLFSFFSFFSKVTFNCIYSDICLDLFYNIWQGLQMIREWWTAKEDKFDSVTVIGARASKWIYSSKTPSLFDR